MDNIYSWSDFYLQMSAIFGKNYAMLGKSKLKIFNNLIMPVVICAYLIASKQLQNPLLKNIFELLFIINLGLLGQECLRSQLVMFLTERTQKIRQYQQIFGLTSYHYLLFNICYFCCNLSISIVLLFFVLLYYNFNILFYTVVFGCFVLTMSNLILLLSAVFNQVERANMFQNLFFLITAILPLTYDSAHPVIKIVCMIAPNSAFTLSITHNDVTFSLISLSLVKVYLIMFYIIDKPHQCRNMFKKYYSKLVSFFRTHHNDRIEMDELMISNGGIGDEVLIQINGMSKVYGGHYALKNVTFNIAKNTIFGLLGRNGAGKTTLVDILTKISEPTEGKFIIHGANPTIGVCYQNELLFEEMTAREHLMFYAKIKLMRDAQASIEQIRASLQLDMDTPVKQLSGGHQRRLSVAIAILNKPSLLLFDEPTSGLDPASRHYLWNIFEQISANSTIILTTHHFQEAERLAHQICILENGVVLERDTVNKIKESYGKGYYLTVTKRRGVNHGQDQNPVIKQNHNHQERNLRHRFSEQFNMSEINIKSYKFKIEQIISDRNHKQSKQNKYFIKKQTKQQSNEKYMEQLIKVIQQIQQKYPQYQIGFQQNCLQQSFLQIIKQNSNDSIDFRFAPYTVNTNVNMELCLLMKVLKQTAVLFYKNMQLFLTQLIASLIIYNFNVVILVLYYVIVNVLKVNQIASADEKKAEIGLLLQGFTFNASAYLTTVVLEKQKSIRMFLNARGVFGISYWLSTFLSHSLCLILNLLLLYLIIPSTMQQVSLSLFVGTWLANTFYVYCCSFLFSKLKSAVTYLTLFTALFALFIFPMIFVADIFNYSTLSYFKYLYPLYTFSMLYAKYPQPPSLSVVYICALIYFVLLLCLEFSIFERLRSLIEDAKPRYNPQLVEMVDVAKQFKGTTALSGVSYSIAGERVALLGHNGAGKSTTFALLSGQLHQSGGEIHIEGKNKEYYGIVMDSVGICYQVDSLWQGLTVRVLVGIVAGLMHRPIKEMKALLDCLELEHANYGKVFKTLSGGNKRKVCLAAALLGDPRLKLLDQCSTGLDPASRVAMRGVITMHEEGSILFTTHAIAEAEKLCERVIIMEKGKVLENEYIENIKNKYFQYWWMDFKQCQEKLQESIVKRGYQIVQQNQGVIRIKINRSEHRLSEVLRYGVQLKRLKKIQQFENVQVKLEDVYLLITKE